MYDYDIREDEFIALKAIWEAASDPFGQPSRRFPYEKAVAVASDAIAKSPMDLKRDPERVMPTDAEEVIAQLDELGYIHVALDGSGDDMYMVFMPVFVGWMVNDLKDRDFSTIVEDPTMDSYVTWAFHYLMWEKDTGIEGRPNALDVADEIESHFKDDKKFEKRWGGDNDLADSAGELVLTQLEENGYIERDFDGIRVTEEGEAAYRKLYDADVKRMKAVLTKTDQDSLRVIAKALFKTAHSNPSFSYIYAAYAYDLVAQQFQGTQATLKAAAESIVEILKDLHCIYINRYGHVRMTTLGEFAISHPNPLDN